MKESGRTRPTWSRVGEIPRVCFERGNLGQSIGVAVLVGTVLFLINQADVVFGGRATLQTWVKIGLSYLVPFLVSNYGIVVGSRRETRG
ncbi:MAG TPA: nitrate/nitrite transporter NrtS [Candidatus Dormibacteraeota bacterium]|nr:nitrate/nitrite transporter NrtS [Candidatus Dormibacteraeota bacterium]